MANSYLQLMGQLKAQSDRLTALVDNAGSAVPPSAASTLTAAIGRAMTALQALASAPAEAAAAAVGQSSQAPAYGTPAAFAAAAQGRALTQQRATAAQAALDALASEAATVIKALGASFSVQRPASLSDALLVRKCEQLETLFAHQGGSDPALILGAMRNRLLTALDQRDQATIYAIVAGLGADYAGGVGISQSAWDATVAQTLDARTVDDPDHEAAAQLYAALSGGQDSLAEFTALAGVLIRSLTPPSEQKPLSYQY